jgi:Kef-type K+ transport system membrane component KefB
VDVKSLQTLFAVSLIAALAPIVVAALPRPRIPQVVVLILCGVIIGNQGLGLQNTDSIKLISNVGLGFLFLLAGYELDPQLLREQAGKLAIIGWVLSAIIAVGVVAILGSFGFIKDFVPVGLALTTTALGTLLPILSDNDMLVGKFGRYVLAAGAVGELLPILAISLFLTGRAQWAALISIAAVIVVALLLTFLPRAVGSDRLRTVIEQGQRSTAQTTLRWSVVLLLLLLLAAARFGLDVVLGALLAGMVLRRWTRRMGVAVTSLEEKLDALGYGFFIPVFFVTSGMTLDVKSIVTHPLRLIVFFFLLLLVRGLPSLLVYRHALPVRQRLEMTFVAATTMPLLIALAEIGLSDGVMIPSNAAALVGAGVLSVLVFPSIASALARGDGPVPGTPEAMIDPVVVTEARVVGEVSADGDAPLPAGDPADPAGPAEPAEPERSAD